MISFIDGVCVYLLRLRFNMIVETGRRCPSSAWSVHFLFSSYSFFFHLWRITCSGISRHRTAMTIRRINWSIALRRCSTLAHTPLSLDRHTHELHWSIDSSVNRCRSSRLFATSHDGRRRRKNQGTKNKDNHHDSSFLTSLHFTSRRLLTQIQSVIIERNDPSPWCQVRWEFFPH